MMNDIPGRNSTGHGGNIHAVLQAAGKQYGEILDFSANINPLGPPEWFRPLISRELDKIEHYPDPLYSLLNRAIADFYKISPDKVVPANGSTDLLYLLPRLLPCKRAVIPVPSYIDYVQAAEMAGLAVQTVALKKETDFLLDLQNITSQIRDNDLVMVASPNNPTGSILDRDMILKLASDFPRSYFLVDEAFLDFVEDGKSVGGKLDNVLTLNSMTKFYGVPGLRIGFGIFTPVIAQKLREHLPPWTVNSLAGPFAIKALEDTEYQTHSRRTCRKLREDLVAQLAEFPQFKIYPCSANYVFIELLGDLKAPALAGKLLNHNILIRCCDNYQGLDDSYFRVAVRSERENTMLLSALHAVLPGASRSGFKTLQKKTPAIMFQGTASNAGKSVLASALCRILLQDGVRVAPFKAQNMSLNSFVTNTGEEMGRAQVVQAQAAKLDPDVRMNPVLLKPNSDTGSQIIVAGRPVGNMSVDKYSAYKPEAWVEVCKSYDSLADEYQAIILEGAGSPGEVNLKHDDIVNMPMARYAQSPVLLVGDIDRGGVYASFVGTMEVLAGWERQLIAGFVVNRFRGQESLLESAHNYLRQHTGREVFGVVPYMSDLGLPEEDSVSFKAGLFNRQSEHEQAVDIVLLNFPHISNFTDVEPFLAEPDVQLRVVDTVADLGKPDAIILPGSKNVIGDLRFVLDKGFSEPLKKCAESGSEIVGICGGYQVLGRNIEDPLGIESNKKAITALGMLDISTELKAEKRLIRQEGVHINSGLPIYGYEIHHGISSSSMTPVLRFTGGGECGSITADHAIWGTYLHGIFDSDSYRRWFIDNLREKKGYARLEEIAAPYDLEIAFDRLADTVRAHLDMDRVYSLLKL